MCKTIHQKVKFKASPSRVYQLLADSKLHTAFSGEKAVIGKKAGDKFTAYGDHIKGINVDMVPGKRLVQAWRTKNFPEGIFSMATFLLTPSKSGTQLELIHRGVPKDLIPKTESGWREFYWNKMRDFLDSHA